MKRVALAALTAILLFLTALEAQAQRSPQEEAYRQRRESLLSELEQTQSQLADIRSQRVQLAARIENVIANIMQQRAQALLMSNEYDALQQLDAMLTSSQDNLLAQRERFMALGDAVRRRTGSVLVVLLRADTAGQQTLSEAQLSINGAELATRTYSATARSALEMGAVDQLHRSEVLPTAQEVTVRVTVNGQTVTETINVTAQRETVTYVEFAVRQGRVTSRTWTSRGTTPF